MHPTTSSRSSPPTSSRSRVEKVAINAVMAGCLPEYLPWVLAALEAVCTDEFNIHGVLATTMPVGPVLICNGPGARAIGMNSGVNAFGQGNRANLTIGRAVQLIVRNVGGGRPGGVDRATHGNPGKLSFCFAEDETGSPFTSLAVSRGFAADDDTVTAFAGEGPRCIVDQLARDPEQLANTFAGVPAHAAPPEAGHRLRLRPGRRPGARSSVRRGRMGPRDAAGRTAPAASDPRQRARSAARRNMAEGVPEWLAGETLGKFRPDGLLLVHAGGGAGLFSAMIGGWANGDIGSKPVTRRVVR